MTHIKIEFQFPPKLKAHSHKNNKKFKMSAVAPTTKAWLFDYKNPKVQMIDFEYSLASLHKLINCKTIDARHFRHYVDGKPVGEFIVWFNDNGLNEDSGKFNKAATQVLGKCPIAWADKDWLVGNYVVSYRGVTLEGAEEDENGDIEPIHKDIPAISFKEFIELLKECKRLDKIAFDEMYEKMMKEMNEKADKE